MNSKTFQAVKVARDVYWVGAIDWDLRNFHGYLTNRGTTYNAYLVMADKPVLIDTVKAPFFDEMMSRIASVVGPEKIEFLVSNHSEMDHSGSLVQTIQALRPRQTLASRMGQKALTGHFHIPPGEITVVGDGDSLELGSRTLDFVETRMCHWPDSMVTYLRDEEILFSQDAFGMHLAGAEHFADEVDRGILDYEAAKYYANILLHLSPFVGKALSKIQQLNLPMRIVAPDHGPIWRTEGDIQHIIGSYLNWSAQQVSLKAVVAYGSMWNSTSQMARAIAEGLTEGGLRVKLMNMSACHRSDVMTELLDAGAFMVGSATMNNNMLPAMADMMTYARGLKPGNLVAAAFGSFGWSGEAPRHLHEILKDMGLDLVADPLRIKYVPDSEALKQCSDLGLRVAAATAALCGGKPMPSREPVTKTKPSLPQKCTINVNNGDRRLETESGKTLFETLTDKGIELPTICGGEGICGLCRVTVTEGGGKPTSAEKGHLNETQLEAGMRLACQVSITDNMRIHIPEEILDAKPFRGRLEKVTELTHDTRLFRIALTEPQEISFTPGQYLKINVPDTLDPVISSRAFSLAGSPKDNKAVELLIRMNPNGICTNWMFRRLKINDEISFSGPYGDFGLSDSNADMIWIAGGSGLSCFRSMLKQMLEEKTRRKCTLLFGAITEADLYLVEQLRSLAEKYDWFSYIPALSNPGAENDWTGETGLITEVLDNHLKKTEGIEAYVCGSPGMLHAAMDVLRKKEIPSERIFFDEFVPAGHERREA